MEKSGIIRPKNNPAKITLQLKISASTDFQKFKKKIHISISSDRSKLFLKVNCYLCNMEISAWKIWRMYLPSGRLFVHPHPVSELDGDARMFFRKSSSPASMKKQCTIATSLVSFDARSKTSR